MSLGPAAGNYPASELERDIMLLPSAARLLTQDRFTVFCAQGVTIPRVLREIGALRERTFRQIGEGAGRVIDLDAFDLFYEHLFAWDAYTRTITGAYRLADVDALRSEGRALYTESLFDYAPAFFDRVGRTVELGRSFVRLENQGGPTLAMLWRGIAPNSSDTRRWAT